MTAGIRTISYRVSFEGRHNELRSKCLLVLYDRHLGKKTKGLTVRELAQQAGVNLFSVKSKIMLWCKWKYLLGYKTDPYTFKIAERGRKWIDRHRGRGMPFDRYLQEIEKVNNQEQGNGSTGES